MPNSASPLRISLRRRAGTIVTFIAVLWLVFLVDTYVFRGGLVQFGIVPRSIRGLPGILFSPFLHASFSHLASNTLGILMLGGLLILRSEEAFWATTILGGLATGLGTWIIGRGDTVTVGASGIIFAYFGYLLFAGIFQRSIGALLLSLLVFVVWGSLLWSALPSANAQISWEAHLTGLAGGALTAKVLAQPKKAA